LVSLLVGHLDKIQTNTQIEWSYWKKRFPGLEVQKIPPQVRKYHLSKYFRCFCPNTTSTVNRLFFKVNVYSNDFKQKSANIKAGPDTVTLNKSNGMISEVANRLNVDAELLKNWVLGIRSEHDSLLSYHADEIKRVYKSLGPS